MNAVMTFLHLRGMTSFLSWTAALQNRPWVISPAAIGDLQTDQEALHDK